MSGLEAFYNFKASGNMKQIWDPNLEESKKKAANQNYTKTTNIKYSRIFAFIIMKFKWK